MPTPTSKVTNTISGRPRVQIALVSKSLNIVTVTGLAGDETTSTGGDRCTLHVHTNLDTLRADGEGAEAELAGGGRVSAEIRVVYNLRSCLHSSPTRGSAGTNSSPSGLFVMTHEPHKPSNAPAPDELLLTAREALKAVLREPDVDHGYTVLMAMNAMGIAARAMGAGAPSAVRGDMSDGEFAHWVRGADAESLLSDPVLAGVRRHVVDKLAVSNPRFKAEERPGDQS